MVWGGATEDVLVYQEDDERFNVGAGRTRDGGVRSDGVDVEHTLTENHCAAGGRSAGNVHADCAARE